MSKLVVLEKMKMVIISLIGKFDSFREAFLLCIKVLLQHLEGSHLLKMMKTWT